MLAFKKTTLGIILRNKWKDKLRRKIPLPFFNDNAFLQLGQVRMSVTESFVRKFRYSI